MKELQERIKKDGIAVNEDILKVDSFYQSSGRSGTDAAHRGSFCGTLQRSGHHEGCNH